MSSLLLPACEQILNEKSSCSPRTDDGDMYKKRYHAGLCHRRRLSTGGERRLSTESEATTKAGMARSRNDFSSEISSNMWSRILMKKSDDWGNGDGDQHHRRRTVAVAFREIPLEFVDLVRNELFHFLRTCRKHPVIPLLSVLVFGVLMVLGLTILEFICASLKVDMETKATWVAMETGQWFSDAFLKALLPVYSLQQAVMQSDYFLDLFHKIGPYGELGSAPSIVGPKSKNNFSDYRNLTGICDEEEMMAKFGEIVDNINLINKLDGIIVAYRLAPYSVFCMDHSLVNTNDFGEGKSYLKKEYIGYDTAFGSDKKWQTRNFNIYANPHSVDISGPFNISQNGVHLTSQMYSGHLSVPLPGYNITVGSGAAKRTYNNTWGFVMHFIDWSELIAQSNIFERFERQGLEFSLTKNVYKNNGTFEVQVIAESAHAANLTKKNSVTVKVNAPNGEWTNCVGYLDGFTTRWHNPLKILCCVLSLIISVLFCIILTERRLRKNLLYKIMPKSAIVKLQHGKTVVERFDIVTIFFSDIVGFTSMAEEMNPVEIMKMLNDLYTEMDKIASRLKVYKVETIGDAYMVIGGAPDRCSGPVAAEKVALFAMEVMDFIKTFRTKQGEQIFLRAGLASGPVMAGVIGNNMPRYCFFGNTVNLASRMESTSDEMKVQCSDMTFKLLRDAPNHIFDLRARMEDYDHKIQVNGECLENTWWIDRVLALNMDTTTGGIETEKTGVETEKTDIETARLSVGFSHNGNRRNSSICSTSSSMQSLVLTKQAWSTLNQQNSERLLMVDDSISNNIFAILENLLIKVLVSRGEMDLLSYEIQNELLDYIMKIILMYNDNHFHSIDHAFHVMLAMNKLCDTLVNAVSTDGCKNVTLCDSFFMDPFDLFGMVFAAFVHDVGHKGVSNKMLTDTQDDLARKYSNVSVAERQSIDIAIELLFSPEMCHLKEAIIPDVECKIKFGHIMFCAILSSDIASPDRLKTCKARFEVVHNVQDSSKKADGFKEGTQGTCGSDRKETLNPDLCPLKLSWKDMCKVLQLSEEDLQRSRLSNFTRHCLEMHVLREHLMQVADVSHCMQDWMNFVKWNFKLYKELMNCHERGLMPDPTPGWDAGQISFLQNYVLPLAARSEKSLGGVPSLNLTRNAEKNISRWSVEGQAITYLYCEGVKNGESEEDLLKKCFSV